jgi:uncharacterized protein (TIGR02271 family)
VSAAETESRPLEASSDGASVVRHDEEVTVGTRGEDVAGVRVRKRVETDRVRDDVPREIEEADVERVAPADGDTGEILTLEDGSVSVPILEEELVITKRTVVRERIIIRKRTATTTERIDTTLRRERVEIDGDLTADERRRSIGG